MSIVHLCQQMHIKIYDWQKDIKFFVILRKMKEVHVSINSSLDYMKMRCVCTVEYYTAMRSDTSNP